MFFLKRGWKNFFINAGIVLASIIVFFILLEIALRVANPQFLQTGIRDLNGSDYSPIQYDSSFGWAYKPNKTWLAGVGNESYLLEINSKGFNNAEPSLETGGKKFVFIGDSFTAGCCVNRSQAFYSVFSRETGFKAVSLGVEGYGTDQELLLLDETGFQYNPNAVVIAFFV
ncbi:SGNH/GDSL hydrolase family protein, partial [Candidatus Micrarchaeota archaeon]|nr:SGNH/GDSL hydrolase family protein [Candidatus Micrarchaeota archaeon]